jgi:hypothetical protein
MPDTYYYSGQSGDSFVDATLHHSTECGTLQDADGGVRPVNSSSVDRNDAEMCPDCTPLGNESSGDSGSSATDDTARSPSAMIDDGECPWCDDYSGDHVGSHASSAHPDEWDDYAG